MSTLLRFPIQIEPLPISFPYPQHDDYKCTAHDRVDSHNGRSRSPHQHTRHKNHGDGKLDAPMDIVYSVQGAQQCGSWREVPDHRRPDP